MIRCCLVYMYGALLWTVGLEILFTDPFLLTEIVIRIQM